ncbi:MAG TPA: efflux RND transporter periplasmic adaptor subunit [Burkholderiales bacterium]|nr:efflux RND transporter periplasmic adaptor subunit [Burkholderiales bacterium]
MALMQRSFLTPVLCALLAALAGCGSESNSKPAASAPRVHLVELAVAEPGRLSYTADRAGSLRAVREVRIVNQEEGRLTEVRLREGDRVKAGEMLVRYDDRILRAELDQSSATLRQAELDHARSRQLKEKGFVSEDAVSRAATALEIARARVRLLQVRVQHMAIAAPFDGVVAQRLVEPGNVTPQHTHLLTVIDPSQLVTDVNVSELVMPYLDVGDRADVRIDALGEKLHPGRIVRIHPSIDAATRTGRVEVVLNPVPPGARPGQFCRVLLSTGSLERLVVPLAALQRDIAGEFVYVFEAKGGTVRRAGVASGLRLADRVEIREGLENGARVVVKGFLGLAAGQQVKPVEPRTARAG